MYYVYILLCSDETYYIGHTANIKQRVNQHTQGLSFSTSYRLPINVKWIGIFTTREKAINFEKYLKTGSGKAFLRKRFI